MLVSDCSGDRILVPYLIVVTRLSPHDHLRTRTCAGSFHVQNESRCFADDQEILAFDAHRFTSNSRALRLPDCTATTGTCMLGFCNAAART